MSKRLLKRFLGRVIERGTLSMTFADGEVVTMGQAESGFPDVALRLRIGAPSTAGPTPGEPQSE